MCSWKQYGMAQLKRVGKALPGICLLTVLLTVCLICLIKGILLRNNGDDKKHIVQIGIVGELDDTYLGMGIRVLTNMEGIREMVAIRPMTEEEAKNLFDQGEISAYMMISPGFVDSILTGENQPITYVTTKEAVGIGSVLVNELVSDISQMVTTTQTSVYAMQTYMKEKGNADYLWEATQGINLIYIDTVLNYDALYELQEIGVSNRISVMGHLFTGIFLILALLWGIHFVSFMIKEDMSLLQMLSRKGIGAGKQVMAENIVYILVQSIGLLCLFLLLVFVKEQVGLSVKEWDIMSMEQKCLFVCKLLPVIWLVSTFQGFLYELTDHVVTGVLLQFLAAVGTAYISGCIYPLSFFPQVVQNMSGLLPISVALRYIQKSLSRQNVGMEMGIMFLYCMMFVGLQIWRRKCRIVKG